MRWLVLLLVLCSLPVGADERISVCFNYGCREQADVVFRDDQLRVLGILLGRALDAAQEREEIGAAIGRMLGWAGDQTPISADRGGNIADGGVDGRMDCIDHSTTTTRLLRLMEKMGWLRFHRVLEPAVRYRFLFFEHHSALIEEIQPSTVQVTPADFVVDSWFFDNGHPAAVLPLDRWLAGESPDVSE